MSLIFPCRLLADISLYYAFAIYLPAFLGHAVFLGGREMVCLFMPVISGTLAYLWKEHSGKKLKFPFYLMPFLLCLPSFSLLLRQSPWLAGMMVFSWIYPVLLLAGNRYSLSYSHYHDRFLACAKSLPAVLLPLLFIPGASTFSLFLRGVLPFAILHLFAGVFLLRQARHAQALPSSRSAQGWNLFFLLAVGGVCLAIGFSDVFPLLGRILLWGYQSLIRPQIGRAHV